MAHEQLRLSTTVRALADVVGDFTDLLQKEVQLARAELSDNLSAKLQGGVWIGIAAALAGLAVLFCLQALVFGLASYGVALHWAFLIVSSGTAILAGLAFFIGRVDAGRSLLPQRTLNQLQQDVIRSKEHLT